MAHACVYVRGTHRPASVYSETLTSQQHALQINSMLLTTTTTTTAEKVDVNWKHNYLLDRDNVSIVNSQETLVQRGGADITNNNSHYLGNSATMQLPHGNEFWVKLAMTGSR